MALVVAGQRVTFRSRGPMFSSRKVFIVPYSVLLKTVHSKLGALYLKDTRKLLQIVRVVSTGTSTDVCSSRDKKKTFESETESKSRKWRIDELPQSHMGQTLHAAT